MLRSSSIVATAFLVITALSAPASAQEETHTWSWDSQDVTGSLAIRMTWDFGAGATCTLRFATWGDVLEEGELFLGRDDASQRFALVDLSGSGRASGMWNLPGDGDMDVAGYGLVRGAVFTLTGHHEGREEWIFVGSGLAWDGNALFDAAFDVELTCDSPFDTIALEAARESAQFGTHDTCDAMQDLPVRLCGQAYAVADSDEWALTGTRNVLRYHQYTFGHDASHVVLYGPDERQERTFVMTSLSGVVSLRTEGGPGTYGYSLTHEAGTYLVLGLALGFHAVETLDQWRDLPPL